MDRQVPARIANILINALKGGVVPRAGLEYITVGRTREISAILHDIDMIEEGGASFRFIVGKYGSGKSFLLQTIRNHSTARGFAVTGAAFRGDEGAGACHLQGTDPESFHQIKARRRRAAAYIGEMDFRHPDGGEDRFRTGRGSL